MTIMILLVSRWEYDESYCDAVKKTSPYDSGPRLLDIIDTAVFDYLIGNADRHHYESFQDDEGASMLILLDNAKRYREAGQAFVSVYVEEGHSRGHCASQLSDTNIGINQPVAVKYLFQLVISEACWLYCSWAYDGAESSEHTEQSCWSRGVWEVERQAGSQKSPSRMHASDLTSSCWPRLLKASSSLSSASGWPLVPPQMSLGLGWEDLGPDSPGLNLPSSPLSALRWR